jgi:cell surface protein SprA
VRRAVPGRNDYDIQGESLLRAMGLDRDGDGEVDFVPNRTVNVETAEIILPYVSPFTTGLASYFREQGKSLPTDGSAQNHEIYDSPIIEGQQPRVIFFLSGTGSWEAAAQGEEKRDTTYIVYLDSTARLAQFKAVRRDRSVVDPFAERTYPLFATAKAQTYKQDARIDSSGTLISFRTLAGDADVRIPYQLPLKEYIALRRRQEWRNVLATEARKPKDLKPRDDVGELLSTITQIQIPIPPNPIFSIFGKPEISLDISGAVDIKAGFRNTKSDQIQISQEDQSRNEPDFNQEVQVNVSGTIGDKLNILADWNTQRTFEYENQLKIKYTGYEDEIVQTVEAGNVSLQTPSTFIGSSQALFGVKAKFQAGPLTLTALASQKKGQIKEVSVSGGAQQQEFQIPVYRYATNHFFVDTLYRAFYEDYYTNDIPQVNVPTQVIETEVWVQLLGTDPNQTATARQGVAFIELPSRPEGGYDETLRVAVDVPGQIETARFVRLEPGVDYEMDAEGALGVLSLNTSVQDNQIVAIAYRTVEGRQYGEFARDLGLDSVGLNTTLVLKMVKPKNLSSNARRYTVAWDQMLKNVYSVGGRNLKKEGFTLDVYRTVAGQEDQNSIQNERLLRVLGLDNYNEEGTRVEGGDGKFDFRTNITVNLARAEVIFPTLRPFDNGLKEYFAALGQTIPDTSEFLFTEIYDTTQTGAQNSQANKYNIKGVATGESSSRYSIGFNIVEGSVQVLLDGQPLEANVDYSVDYIIGEVVIRNGRALVPGANVQIKYEQNDLFQLASKTLLGARGELAISQTTGLGFTVMNLNQETLSDKVRLGEEPNNNTIFGVDGTTTIETPFLTKALDALPLLQTKEKSQLKVTGEAAYMLPDPNTKKSTITSDQGEGVAYIDDFEGARRTIPLGIPFTQWTLASPPADSVTFPSLVPDTAKAFFKGKFVWYNRLPTDVLVNEIYPNKQVGRDQQQVTVLDFLYTPAERGPFNYSPDINTTLTPQSNWGGVMKPISISATNLISENINFIEIWMRVDKAPADSTAKMVIDIGSISEDVIPNRALNSEDLVLSPNINGTLQEGEDIGLDMLTNDEEVARFGTTWSPDPSGDNFSYQTSSSDFRAINGTEDNKTGPGGLIPDTEDLNSNGVADLINQYFQYELSLDTVRFRNPRIVGGGNEGWYQFRVPLREFERVVGSPNFENVEYIRVFFRNATDTIWVRIADFNLVGNQWLEQRKEDSTMTVSVVNVEDNPEYVSPPGVLRERDPSRPDEDILANEQSLSLQIKGLQDGESRAAVKYYTFRPLDLFNYRVMKMFVYGDESFMYVDTTNYDAEVFFRFGLDTLNYYEYRAPIRQAWDPANDMVVRFEDLTAIKQGRDSTNVISPPLPVENGPPGAVYRVLGNPSVTQVRFLAVGVTNPTGKGTTQPLNGQVWVNELRLISVDDSPGLAYRFDTQLKLADFGNVSFNYSKVDPSFHTLEQRFGSRQTGTNWGLAATAQLEKLLPSTWTGTTLAVSYSHTDNFVTPKYLPNSDVLVDEAAEQEKEKILTEGGTQEEADAEAARIVTESETHRVTDTYSAPSVKIGLPSKEWYIRDTFNKLALSANYTRSTERSPATVNRLQWAWTGKISYAHNFSPNYFISPFKGLFDGLWFLDEYKNIKIYFAPSTLAFGVGAARSRTNQLQRAPGSQETITRNFTSNRNFSFGWKLTEGAFINPSGSYSLNVESSLLHLETDTLGQQRPFSDIMGDIFGGSGKLVNFGNNTRYSQQNQILTKPSIPNIFNIKKYFDLSLGYDVNYSWQNTLTGGDLGKSVGYTNNVNLSTNIKLKQIFDPLFGDTGGKKAQPPAGRGRRGAAQPKDSTAVGDTTSTGKGGLGGTLEQLGNLIKILIKTPFLDYDNISLTFTQTNTASNSGIVGGTGFANFWAIPFVQAQDPQSGPTRLYQLGLITDPTGTLTNFGPRDHFPFFGWDTEPGIRALAGGDTRVNLSNTYRQTNRVNLKTSRSLWEGARLDLNWNINWTYGRNETFTTDSLGYPDYTGPNFSSTITGSIDRSFLTFPDVLFLGVFNTGLPEVGKRYAELKANGDSTQTDEAKLSQAFEEGFEAIPWLKSLFGQFYPRVNWTFRWDGLEKLPMFAGFASRVSLDHAYSSSYARNFRNLPGGGGEVTDNQRVSYAFNPLVGVNVTFKELFKGNFGGNLRYSTQTSYDLNPSSRNIIEGLTQEISLTASYSRKGFEIPLFGLALNNDVDVSFSYSVSKNSRRTYEVAKLEFDTEGAPLEGSTRTVIEPRIKYVLSSRVNASVYYRHTKITPDDSGSRIPGQTINEAGLDVHISIR